MRINRLIDSPNLAESKLYVGFGSDKIIGMYRDSFEFTRDYGGVVISMTLLLFMIKMNIIF
jgi:hypothetical protein